MKKVIALIIGVVAVIAAVCTVVSVKAEPSSDGGGHKVVYRLYNPKDNKTHETEDADAARDWITSGKGVYNGATIYHADGRKVTNVAVTKPTAREASAATSLKHGWTNTDLSVLTTVELAMMTKDAELKAAQNLYNDANYDVTFHYGNGIPNKTIEYHGKNPVKLPQPIKAGWFLRGWSKTANTTTVDYKGGQVVEGLAPGKTKLDLYAVYYQPTDFNFVVDLSDFKVYVRDTESGKLWKTFDCTIGEPGNDTPTGQFQIQRKYLYDYMPLAEQDVWYTSYFTSTGVAFHAAPWRYYGGAWHLGQRASHGCINMRTEDAQWIYEHCKVGDAVLVQE